MAPSGAYFVVIVVYGATEDVEGKFTEQYTDYVSSLMVRREVREDCKEIRGKLGKN